MQSLTYFFSFRVSDYFVLLLQDSTVFSLVQVYFDRRSFAGVDNLLSLDDSIFAAFMSLARSVRYSIFSMLVSHIISFYLYLDYFQNYSGGTLFSI